MADHSLLDAWVAEPDPVDESDFTPWATPGWASWNNMSAEVDFARFVGMLAKLLRPDFIVETGVGQGFSTRRISCQRGPGVQLCFESDPELREALRGLPFFSQPGNQLSSASTPSGDEFARADLTVLDSDPGYRFDELSRWREYAHKDSTLVVHDCGNGHPSETLHAKLADLVDHLDVPGIFLRNPRGGFVGIHPGSQGLSTLHAELNDALDECRRLQDHIARMEATVSWRVTKPIRTVQARRLRRKNGRGAV